MSCNSWSVDPWIGSCGIALGEFRLVACELPAALAHGACARLRIGFVMPDRGFQPLDGGADLHVGELAHLGHPLTSLVPPAAIAAPGTSAQNTDGWFLSSSFQFETCCSMASLTSALTTALLGFFTASSNRLARFI